MACVWTVEKGSKMARGWRRETEKRWRTGKERSWKGSNAMENDWGKRERRRKEKRVKGVWASGKIKESSNGNPERGPGSYRGFHGCLLSRYAHALHATLSSHLIRSRLIARVFPRGPSLSPSLSLAAHLPSPPLSRSSFLILLPSHFPVLFLPLATLSRTFATSIQFCLICSRLPRTSRRPIFPGPPTLSFISNSINASTDFPPSRWRTLFLSDTFPAVRK